MIRRLRYVVGHVEQENAKREEHNNPDLHFLTWRAEKDGKEQYWRQDAGQNDVHNVEGMTTSHVDDEGNVGELLVRAVLVVELLAMNLWWAALIGWDNWLS